MEREILFRGKRVDNGEWVVGSLVKMGPAGYAHHFILPDYASAFYDIEVDLATVCQYTGLTDKNGVKIFEGDILCDDEPKDPSGKYLPVFGRVCFGVYHSVFFGLYEEHVGFFVEWEDNEDDDYSNTFRKDLGYWARYPHCEVRGNIHDNPTLWEEET